MMGVGIGEMILIAGVALVVIGPEKFPDFAKIVLRTMRDLRGYVDDAKRDISNELRPVKRELEDLSRYDPEDYIDSLAGAVTGEDEEGDEDEDMNDEQDAHEQSPHDDGASSTHHDQAEPEETTDLPEEFPADETRPEPSPQDADTDPDLSPDAPDRFDD